MGKQPTWIPRAVVAAMFTGLAAIGVLLLSGWLYPKALAIAPDWLKQPEFPRPDGYLGTAWVSGTVFALIGVVVVVGSTLMRLLKIPLEAIDPVAESPTFPFNRRRRTRRAMRQPGSEEYLDHKVQLLGGLTAALRGVRPAKGGQPDP